MGKYVAEQTRQAHDPEGLKVNREPVIVLGLTFKEDCPYIRNFPRRRRDPRIAIVRSNGFRS